MNLKARLQRLERFLRPGSPNSDEVLATIVALQRGEEPPAASSRAHAFVEEAEQSVLPPPREE